MKLGFTDIAKKNISLLIILLLAAVCSSSFEMSSVASGSSGSIMENRRTCIISHSLIACTPAAANRDSDGGQKQNIEKAIASSDILSSIARKFTQITGGCFLPENVFHFKIYSLSICKSVFACLFLLTHIIFIHLQDGSK